MKKPLVLAIAAMALTAGAQAESKFYGKMNVSVEYADESFGDTQVIKLNSNASRLGVKGSEDLGSGTKVVYQAEYQTDVDGNGAPFSQRDTYLGLAYKGMGTVKMGIMDTPLKKSKGNFDLFNDVYDMKAAFAGENRLANSINYTSEKFGALQASVSYIMKETDGVDDGISASLVFNEGDIYAAVAIDDKTKTDDTSTIRGTVIYTMGDIRLGALVNNVDKTDTADDELGFGANVAFTMGANTAKFQFLTSDQGGATGGTMVTFGVDHKLAKSTKAYAYVDLTDSDVDNTDATGISVGLEHKF
jgi:predicted porin